MTQIKIPLEVLFLSVKGAFLQEEIKKYLFLTRQFRLHKSSCDLVHCTIVCASGSGTSPGRPQLFSHIDCREFRSISPSPTPSLSTLYPIPNVFTHLSLISPTPLSRARGRLPERFGSEHIFPDCRRDNTATRVLIYCVSVPSVQLTRFVSRWNRLGTPRVDIERAEDYTICLLYS